MAEKYRRKKILVDKRFQLGISLRIILCLACYLLLFCLMAVFSPLLVVLAHNASEMEIQGAMAEILVFVKNLLLPLALTFACLALHCMLLSHRIAGPAYRLKRTFEAARDGDLSIDVRLRKGDYLTDVADGWNEMITRLREDAGRAKELAAAIAASVPGGEEQAELAGKADELRELLARYRTTREAPASEVAAEDPAGEVSAAHA